jgi:hypothetical protein
LVFENNAAVKSSENYNAQYTRKEKKRKPMFTIHRCEGVSKLATNASKTAVMDVIEFPYLSLGSSIVQLHDSLCSRCTCTCSEAGFSIQNDDHA